MTHSILARAALYPWLLFCALSWSQGTIKPGSRVIPVGKRRIYAQKENNRSKAVDSSAHLRGGNEFLSDTVPGRSSTRRRPWTKSRGAASGDHDRGPGCDSLWNIPKPQPESRCQRLRHLHDVSS